MKHLIYPLAVSALMLGACSQKKEAPAPPGTIPPAATKAEVTFDVDIKPIFGAACIECHGEKKQKGELRLDTREATIKGGEEGPIFEIGRSEESVLVMNVARAGSEDDWMPPIDKGDPLTLEQIALIRAWIDQGAK